MLWGGESDLNFANFLPVAAIQKGHDSMHSHLLFSLTSSVSHMVMNKIAYLIDQKLHLIPSHVVTAKKF